MRVTTKDFIFAAYAYRIIRYSTCDMLPSATFDSNVEGSRFGRIHSVKVELSKQRGMNQCYINYYDEHSMRSGVDYFNNRMFEGFKLVSDARLPFLNATTEIRFNLNQLNKINIIIIRMTEFQIKILKKKTCTCNLIMIGLLDFN
jgi:hypothetical protein